MRHRRKCIESLFEADRCVFFPNAQKVSHQILSKLRQILIDYHSWQIKMNIKYCHGRIYQEIFSIVITEDLTIYLYRFATLPCEMLMTSFEY